MSPTNHRIGRTIDQKERRSFVSCLWSSLKQYVTLTLFDFSKEIEETRGRLGMKSERLGITEEEMRSHELKEEHG
jgi:hypothetical protein